MKSYILLLVLPLLMLCGCTGQPATPEDFARNVAESAQATGATVVNAAEGAQTSKSTEYSTEYPDKNDARAHNIKLAAQKLNGAVIQPGETFSFNDTLGPSGKDSGFKKARIFIRGRDAEGYGGGICQVSSTLYNCALALNLNIVERHPHSKAVGYVPENKDAATSYGGKDLRFENTLGKPLKVTASAAEGTLKVVLAQIE